MFSIKTVYFKSKPNSPKVLRFGKYFYHKNNENIENKSETQKTINKYPNKGSEGKAYQSPQHYCLNCLKYAINR